MARVCVCNMSLGFVGVLVWSTETGYADRLGAVKEAEHKVLRLRKALYGLRQAPRAWNAKLDATMGALGFTRCATEHALYTR